MGSTSLLLEIELTSRKQNAPWNSLWWTWSGKGNYRSALPFREGCLRDILIHKLVCQQLQTHACSTVFATARHTKHKAMSVSVTEKQAGEIIALGEQSDCFLSQWQKSAWYRDSEKASGRPLWWWWFHIEVRKDARSCCCKNSTVGRGWVRTPGSACFQVPGVFPSQFQWSKISWKVWGNPWVFQLIFGLVLLRKRQAAPNNWGRIRKATGYKCRRETDPASASPGENEMVFWIRGLDKPTPRNFSYRLHSEGDFFQSERCWKPFTRW